MSQYRHVVDGSIQIPLPDDPVERSKAFAEVAAAWSTMLFSIEHLHEKSRQPARLSGGVQLKTPQELAEEASRLRVTLPPQIDPAPPRANGKHKAAAKGKKKRKGK